MHIVPRPPFEIRLERGAGNLGGHRCRGFPQSGRRPTAEGTEEPFEPRLYFRHSGCGWGKNTAAAPEIFTWAERFPRGMGKSSPLYCNIPAGASLAERWSLPQPGPGEFISRRDPRKRLSAVTERSTRGVLEYRNDLKLQAISGILKACGGHRHRLSISRAWICGVFALQASSDMSGGSGEVKTRRSPVKGWVSASRAEWSAGREMSSGRSVP